ncbi:hypothetical protein CCHR01_10667 [Colletotrichum chrysophilum]|uniref:Uncharacterized protein n=1 Tax=Colletotrichum chrysophilum TaxID=1836956 RepID=A0AAD9AJJ6_9PEZI|nr:hypothetical protein CCHR01_10667 [Colletotrichum chrysophilum]
MRKFLSGCRRQCDETQSGGRYRSVRLLHWRCRIASAVRRHCEPLVTLILHLWM